MKSFIRFTVATAIGLGMLGLATPAQAASTLTTPIATANVSTHQITVDWTDPNGGSVPMLIKVLPDGGINGFSVLPGPFVHPGDGQYRYTYTPTAGTSWTFQVFRNDIGWNGMPPLPSTGWSDVSVPVSFPKLMPSTPVATYNDGSVTVTWSHPNDNSDIGGYYIFISKNHTCENIFTNGGTYTANCFHRMGGNTRAPGDTSTTNTMLIPLDSGNWTFAVEPFDFHNQAGKMSAWSDSLFIPSVPEVPSAPVATAGNGQATVHWNAPFDGGSPITLYYVQVYEEYQGEDPTCYTFKQCIGTGPGGTPPFPFITLVVRRESLDVFTQTGTSLVVPKLINGHVYMFTVVAVNERGAATDPQTGNTLLSPMSNRVIPVAAVPSVPTAVSANADTAQATITWIAPADGGSPIIGYEIQVSDGTIRTVGAVTTTVIANLIHGKAYTFGVRAINSTGKSELSTLSNSVTLLETVPLAPSTPVVVAGNGQVTVSWLVPATPTGATPITGYNVLVSNGTNTTVLVGPVTKVVISHLTNGRAYNFRVQAINKMGPGAVSLYSKTVTPVAPPKHAPSAPVIKPATQGAVGGARTATAAWVAPASAGTSPITLYKVIVWRCNGAGAACKQYTAVNRTPATVAPDRSGVRHLAFTLPTGSFRFSVIAVSAHGLSPASAKSNAVAPR